MKNRGKLLNSLLIILSIFILGIINVYAKEIEVESFDVVDKSDTISVEQLNYTNDTVSSNIKFNQQDDYVIFGLNLKNNGSKKYKIVSITDNNTNNNIQITYNYSNESFNTSEVTDISIKMLYKNKLINVSEKNINDLKITILLEDDLGNQEQISVNPFTGDHIYLYLIIFIISGGSLIIIINGHKKARFVLLLTFLLIPCSIFALEQYKINILFDDIVVKGELENYNVVIDDGNNNSYDVVVEYGKKIPSLPTPSKDGYTFKEWQDEDGNVVTTDTIITKSLHLTAIYNINHYQITYSLDDGVVSNPDDYTIEDNITLNNPSKSGYIFVGWTGSNGDTPQLEVTIPTGSMGDKNYTANYIINDHVLYTVIHKTMNLDGKTYSVKDIDELYGTAFSEVTPALKNYEGFTSPSAKKININPNGSSTVEYLYTRNKYTLTLQDTDYIDTTFSSGEYYYGTEINVKAKDKTGYTFVKWSDNTTSSDYTFNISNDITLKPIYTANINTPYKVIHKKMNVTGDAYFIYETDLLEGASDTFVTPLVKDYYGFTAPAAQEVKIKSDGSTEVTYYYQRNKFTLTLEDSDYINTTFNSGEYYYETEINVKARNKTGYTFVKWSDNSTDINHTFNLNDNTTIKPIYSANSNTAYKVIHKKMNIDGVGYTIAETENLEGTSDTFVTPAVKDYEGFTAPTAQEIKIKADGTASVEYLYSRNKYTLTLQDTDYIDTTFSSGEYYYGTEINVKAKDKTGYTFVKWSDNSTDINHTFNLNDNTTIKPIYSANSNTAYKVIHKKMNIDGAGYTVAETENLEGTSDTFVTPAVKDYEGFTAPAAQEIKIKADGTASVEYLYARNQYTLTITNEEYVDTTTYSGLYYYGTNITLSPKSVPGYKFNKWSNDSTSNQITFSILTDTTIGPIFDANSYSIRFDPNVTGATGSMDIIDTYYGTSVALPTPAFELDNYRIYAWNTKSDGTGVEYGLTDSVSNLTTSDGVTVTLYALWEEHLPSYSHVAPIEFDGQTIIDTHMKLFSESNYMKNFEISLDIDNIDDDRFLNSGVRDTIVNSIHEVTPWPGTAFRIDGSKYEFVGTNGTVSKKPTLSKDSINKSVKILRIGQKLYYKVDNNQPVLINDFSGFNLFFEDTVTLGGTLEADGVTPKPSRYFKGTISNISIRFLPNSVTIDDYDPTSNLKIVYSMPESHSFDGTPATMLTPTYENEEGELVPFRFFTEENIDKDFYISFDLNNYVRDGQVNQATLLNIKYENEAAGYPGYVLRVINNNTKFHSATSLGNVPNKKTTTFNDNISSFYVQRIDGVIGYGYDNSGLILLDDFSEFTDYFDTPLTLGDNGSGDRCMKNTTISNLLIKIGD